MDQSTMWVSIAIGIVAVLGYLVVMRVFFKDSKELDKKIDMSKMKPWKDDD